MAIIARRGGRTARNTAAIHGAVHDLILEKGLDFTFEDVALKSGVARRTLHRRWDSRMALIMEMIETRYRSLDFPKTGDFAEDLRSFAYHFREFCDDPIEIALNGLAAISAQKEFAELNERTWRQANEHHLDLFELPQKRGEISPALDAKTLLMMLTAPIVINASILRRKMSDSNLDLLIGHIIRLARAPAPMLRPSSAKRPPQAARASRA